ncbi:hypothetical protein Asulf_01373 [Archaeoglobus sulfaticallidus PM70-1]|uniref:Ribbon-helix-helix protein CopG domain-containing protein n=1 Tax=Archaeoglobus sulfaticallidus PM70-1 TaxID=387631 RepID=N0BCM4_9EURY|nr:hypothetical protein [Archaeoglobus sulfaticallidus]AGK61364.1 hypothetical protein Asulf_01373 [Archaeoglobus sulfaticallidus PM70-1]
MGGRYKRVQVMLSNEQYNLIKLIRKKLGLSSDSETVKVIVFSWLAEKSIISAFIKDEILLGDENEKQQRD